eukprot:XP_019921143.1 PREDICTED: uncharacterized protein LOC109618251 [Crassostrea gigas]
MKSSLFILFVLLSWCLIDSTGIVIHSKRTAVCPRVCHSVCHLACPSCHKECDNVCHDACSRKRNGAPQLPCAFAAWDKNGDTHVDFEEFSSIAYPFFNKRHLSLVFQSIDTDRNQKILETEMKEAIFLFEHC